MKKQPFLKWAITHHKPSGIIGILLTIGAIIFWTLIPVPNEHPDGLFTALGGAAFTCGALGWLLYSYTIYYKIKDDPDYWKNHKH